MDLELVFVTFQILVATCIRRPGFNLELIFATFQKATLGSGGGHPGTRSVLEGHAVLFWTRGEGTRSQFL